MSILEKYLYKTVTCRLIGPYSLHGILSEVGEDYFNLYGIELFDSVFDTYIVDDQPYVCLISQLSSFKEELHDKKFRHPFLKGKEFDSAEELFKALELKAFW